MRLKRFLRDFLELVARHPTSTKLVLDVLLRAAITLVFFLVVFSDVKTKLGLIFQLIKMLVLFHEREK